MHATHHAKQLVKLWHISHGVLHASANTMHIFEVTQRLDVWKLGKDGLGFGAHAMLISLANRVTNAVLMHETGDCRRLHPTKDCLIICLWACAENVLGCTHLHKTADAHSFLLIDLREQKTSHFIET